MNIKLKKIIREFCVLLFTFSVTCLLILLHDSFVEKRQIKKAQKQQECIVEENDSNAVYGAMFYTMDEYLGKYSLDSMINADNLSVLDEWIPSYIVLDDKKIYQYVYIKKLEETEELIYTVTLTDNDTIYKCTKRIVDE